MITSEQMAVRAMELFDEYRESFGLTNADFPKQRPEEQACKFEDEFCKLICEYKGHEIGTDQCGKPEHDLCYRCRERRVDIEKREREAVTP